MKKCSRCKAMKPLTDFNKHARTKSGLHPQCKSCISKDHKDRRERYKLTEKNIPEEKFCPTCKTVKKNNEFHVNNSVMSGLSGECKACFSDRKKKYLSDHPQRVREINSNWYDHNKEKRSEYFRQYRNTDKGKELHRFSTQRRQATKKNLTATLTVDEWAGIIEKQNNKCNMCQSEFSDLLIPTQDHIYPLSRGGEYTKENIQALCRSCNSKKGTKIL